MLSQIFKHSSYSIFDSKYCQGKLIPFMDLPFPGKFQDLAKFSLANILKKQL